MPSYAPRLLQRYRKSASLLIISAFMCISHENIIKDEEPFMVFRKVRQINNEIISKENFERKFSSIKQKEDDLCIPFRGKYNGHIFKMFSIYQEIRSSYFMQKFKKCTYIYMYLA